MRILILDDIQERHDAFDRIYQDHEVAHAYVYHSFCDKLKFDGPWDLIHLDHDLGDFPEVPDYYLDGWGKRHEYNGTHAAKKISELSDQQLPKKVIIHSLNPVGSKNMLNDLTRRGVDVTWQPFDEGQG